MTRLYNKFKPAGYRKFVSPTKSYSEITKNNDPKSRLPPPPKGKNTVDESIHNPHNPNSDINRKLDQILDILSNLKKDMNELDTRIAKLEAYRNSSIDNTSLPPPTVPIKVTDPIIQI